MIIKEPDDKSSDLAILEGLLSHPHASSEIRKRIEQEIKNIRAGMRGEQETAYELKVHFGSSKNWMIIHDLRIEHEGLVAQIDHLMIGRFLLAYVCESKHFNEGVGINDHGEFTAFFNGKPYGVPSPIEQNKRHILILNRFFKQGPVKLPTRMGLPLRPELKSVILVSNKARINRPKVTLTGMETVMKNEQFANAFQKDVENDDLVSVLKLVSSETLEALAREIASHHKPLQFNWMEKFGLTAPDGLLGQQPPAAKSAASTFSGEQSSQPATIRCNHCTQAVSPAEERYCIKNATKFDGKILCQACQKSTAVTHPIAAKDASLTGSKDGCAGCSGTVSFAEAKFCRMNKARFKGSIYCRTCQSMAS